MIFLQKNITRNVFSSTLVFFVLFLLTVGTAAAGYRDEIPVPFSQIIWDHPDVSGWRITSDLDKVYISGSQIHIAHSKTCAWPAPDRVCNANAWVIHKSARDNKWHANTWDFMRVCQDTKLAHMGDDYGWSPRTGEEIYLFISGIARPGYEHFRNVEERTNIVKYYWNSGVGYPPPSCSGAPVINSFASSAATIIKGQPVTLSWSIAKAESIKIVTDKGKIINVAGKDPVADSITLSLEKTTTFTISADNCDTGTLPSSQVTVSVVEGGLPWLAPLLLSSPVVTTAPASNIQDVSADLQGTVKTFGRDAVVAFEYGTTTSYGLTIAGNPAIVNNTKPEEITATVTGLDQGTDYYFRLIATSGSRVFYGEGRTFKTDDVPEAYTDPPTSVTSTGAILKGKVNPNGASTNVSFQFGVSAGEYPFAYDAIESPVTGSTERQVSSEVTGLTPGYTYYYRVRANNGIGGDVYGEEQPFTTPAAAP